MKSKTMRLVLLTVIAFALVLTSACGGNKDTTQTTTATTAAPAATETTAAAQYNPFGKYEPAIKLTSMVPNFDSWIKLPEGDSAESNAWTRGYLEELGINAKVLWTSGSDKQEEKMNLAISSGELPDLFPVNRLQFEQLAAAGKLADLTEAFNNYASPFVKEHVFGELNSKALQLCTKDGKLLGLPNNYDSVEFSQVVWIRSDWLKKLNLPEPKTIDDIETIARAFMTNPVTSDGKSTEYGVSCSKDLINATDLIGGKDVTIPTEGGFWGSFHAYPGMWVKDEATGKLVCGGTLPGMREGLLKLQDWYKKGILSKEFGTKEIWGNIDQDMSAEKVGIVFGGVWGCIYTPMDPENPGQWKAYPLPTADGKPAKVGVGAMSLANIYVVRNGYEHPEAAIKMVNMMQKVAYDPAMTTKESSFKYLQDDQSNYPFAVALIYAEPLRKNYNLYLNLKDAIKTKDTSKLRPDEFLLYEGYNKFINGEDKAFWYTDINYGPNSSNAVVEHYLSNNLYEIAGYYGPATATTIAKGPTINKLWLQTATKIIMGGDITEFDSLVSTAKTLGLDEIEKEVNEWYAAQPK